MNPVDENIHLRDLELLYDSILSQSHSLNIIKKIPITNPWIKTKAPLCMAGLFKLETNCKEIIINSSDDFKHACWQTGHRMSKF